MAPRARFELATLRLTAECSTIELPGIISILCYLRSIFKQRLGDMGAMIRNNRGETHLDTTTAVGLLLRSREKGLLEEPDAIAKLALLAKYGRYKHSILEDARLKLEAKP